MIVGFDFHVLCFAILFGKYARFKSLIAAYLMRSAAIEIYVFSGFETMTQLFPIKERWPQTVYGDIFR